MRLLLVVVVGLLAVGCGGEDEMVGPASEDEVRTSKCPATFAADFEAPVLFWSSISAANFYSASQRSKLLQDMEAAKERGAFTATFSLLSKASGVCNYSTAGIPGAPDTITRLETRSGINQLKIDAWPIRYYATVGSYAPDGLVLGSDPASVYGRIPVHERDDLVYVGDVVVRNAQAPTR